MTGMDSLDSGAPVGRTRELDDLLRAYHAQEDGTSGTVFVGGEPGIGKSHLLQCFTRIVSDQAGVVVRGNCYEDVAATPYGPFVEVLRGLEQQAGAHFEPRVTSALGSIVPEWADRASGETPLHSAIDDVAGRVHLFDAVARQFALVASQQPVALVLDDLQWADEPTAFLLRYVARALRGSRVAIVGAYRDTDLDPALPFEAVLRDLQREHLARRVSLRRLSPVDTRALMAGLLNTSVDRVSNLAFDRVQEASEGVPFFIEELVLHLREEGRLALGVTGVWDLQGGLDIFVPPGVRSVVGHRLSRLSPEARETLDVASIIGKEFGLDLLQQVLSHREPDGAMHLGRSVDEAVRRRLIVEHQRGSGHATSFSFAHEQIREVLYWGINAIRRRSLHEVIGRELEHLYARRQSTPAQMAHHFSNGDDLAKAALYSRLAGDDAARSHAYEDALRHYDSVLEILDLAQNVEVDERERFDTLLARDSVLARSGDTVRREQSIQILLNHAHESGRADRQFEAEVRAARHSIGIGDIERGIHYATTALSHAADLEERDRLSASWLLAQAHVGRPEGEPSQLDRPVEMLTQAVGYLSDARSAAERMGDAVTVAWITQEMGVVLWALSAEDDVEGRSRARTFLVEALEGFRAAGNRKGEVTALIALAYRRPVAASPSTGSAHGSYVAFLEEIRRLRKTEHLLARESERPRLEALSLLSIHLYCRTEGWYEVALDRATQALVWSESAHVPRIGMLARLGLSETEALIGRGPRALQYAEEAAARLDAKSLDGNDSEGQRGPLLTALARAQLLLGNHSAAIDLARRRLALAQRSGRNADLAESEVQLAEVLIGVGGHYSDAERHARTALDRSAHLPGNITWDIRAYLVLARVALQRGDGPEALSLSTAAISRTQARDTNHVWLRTSASLVHGLALEASGELDSAKAAIRGALEHVQRAADRIECEDLRDTFLTSAPWVVEVRSAAERLGLLSEIAEAPKRPTLPGGLTPREVEVVSLIAAGKTNREIADDLFISEKTVARHLTNIYTKIDSQSRTQAAAWAFRQGIA